VNFINDSSKQTHVSFFQVDYNFTHNLFTIL